MNKNTVIKIIDWLSHLIGYTIVLILTSLIFKNTIHVDTSNYYVWGFLAVLIISILNKTIKPLIFWITIPLTALTFGLFYPIINIIILKLTDILLASHFEIRGIFSLFFASIFISFLNVIMDHFFIDKILRRVHHNG